MSEAADFTHQLISSEVDKPGRNQIQTYSARCGLIGIRNQYVMSAWFQEVTCPECKGDLSNAQDV